MQTFSAQEGSIIMDKLIITIQNNKQYLSDIDGLIGDGDHGVNMNKGFTLCREELDKKPGDLVYSMKTLARILLMEIGGSMGPLYGKFFKHFTLPLEGKAEIGGEDFALALESALTGIQSVSTAVPGDKTLLDTLVPAIKGFRNAMNQGKSFTGSLDEMIVTAREGLESTKEMVAKVGRASRLGERSKGVPDAGASSCFLILESMATSIKNCINK